MRWLFSFCFSFTELQLEHVSKAFHITPLFTQQHPTTMRSISINYSIDASYKIKGFEHYVFGKDKRLYNTKRGTKIKRCIVNYTKGYYLQGKFYILNKIKPLLI